MDETSRLHAELYHRQKIAALRAEGERLRTELRLRGVDPGSVLMEAGIDCSRIVQNPRDGFA